MSSRILSRFAFFLAALALTSAPAIAADSGPYIVAGVSDVEIDYRPTATDHIDDGDTGFEIGVGFAFDRYLSLELSYLDFGEPTGFAGCPPDVVCIAIVPFAVEPVRTRGWSGAVRGALPLTEYLSLFARLGLLVWDTSAVNQGLNDSGSDALYGVGLALEATPRLDLQLSYERAELDIELLKIGARWRF